MDPVPFPTEFPGLSLRVLLDFVRAKKAFGREVAEAAYTILGYGAHLGIPPAPVAGPLSDPAPLETKVAEALTQALESSEVDGPNPKAGVVPWLLILEFVGPLVLRWATNKIK